MKYSQKDEQDYILKAVEFMETGCFLDIGAYDGYNYSNTMCLVERGWWGVMVEPGLEAFQALLARHGGNEKIDLVHGAVGDGSMQPFWNNTRTYSTTSIDNRDRFINEGFSPRYWVPTLKILQLLERGPYDVVSIDTEGTSVAVMRDLLLIATPKVICVEHDGAWVEIPSGYKTVMQNEENIIFVR